MSASEWTSRIENSPKEKYDKLLFDATVSGQLQDVEKLLSLGARITHFEEEGGKTALHVAAEFGYTEKLKLLTQAAGPVALLDENKRTPLYYAAVKGHSQALRILLEHPNNPDYRLNKALAHAIREKQYETTGILLDYLLKELGSDAINFLNGLMNEAAETADMNMVDVFLQKGAGINSGMFSEFTNKGIGHELHSSFVENGDCSCSENEGRGFDYNPLITATNQNNLSFVKWLIAKRAKVDILVIIKDGSSFRLKALPLVDYAKKLGHKEIAEYLKTLQPKT